MVAGQDFRGRDSDGPVAVVSAPAGLSHTDANPLAPEFKAKTSRRRRLASPLLSLGAALALCAVATGCDPRLPYVRPQEELVSVPPTIDLASVFPPPATLPVEVLLGDDCVSENTFNLDSVVDGDLAVGERLTFRWRIVANLEAGPVPRLMSVTLGENVGDAVGTPVSSTFTIDREGLNGAFLASLNEMIGRTHRVEVRVTDGDFATSPTDTIELASPTMGSAYFYWLFTLDDQPCG